MFNPFRFFNVNLHPMMDEEGGGTGGPAPQGTEGDVAGGESGADGSQGTEGGSASPTADPPSQTKHTPDQNAAFAEMRVKASAAERRAQEAETSRQRDVGIAKKYGAEYGVFSESDIAEKYGQSGIKTLADFESALQQQEAQKAGIDPNLINNLVSNHPTVQKANQFIEQMSQQQAQSMLNSEIAELAEEYPDLKLKTLADVKNLPNAEAVLAKAQKGYTLLDAYVSVNREEIRNQAREQGAQQTIRNIGSKSHLGTEKSGNAPQGKEVEISPEKMRVWKSMGYSEAEARKREAKYLKK